MSDQVVVQQDQLKKFDLFNIGDCQHCHKPYNNPHILNCLHTFCLDCIKQMSHGSDPKCSVCEEKFDILNDGLPSHYSNRSFEDLARVRLLMGKVNDKLSCELCKKNTPKQYCRECKMVICEHDAKIHRKSTKDEHQLFDLNFFRDYENIFKLIPENTMNYCKQHPEKLIEFYCYKCNVVLCTECAHAGHMSDQCYTNEMNSMFHGRRQMVTQRETEQGVKIENLSVQVQHHSKQIEEITKEEEELLNKINKEFNDYINKLVLRKDELTNRVTTVFAQRRKELEKVITAHKDFIRDSKHLLDMTSFFLNDLPGTHLFPPAVAICNKMDSLERSRPAISADLNQLDFAFTRDSHYSHEPQRLGKLSFRFPLGFESSRHDVEVSTKMKLPFDFKIKGMSQTSKGTIQLFLQEKSQEKGQKKKNNQNHILRLNNCFQPVHANKWLERITSLDDCSDNIHLSATPEGTSLIVDRNNRLFRSISNGRVNSSLSRESNSNNCLQDPVNVIGRQDEGFIVFNKESNIVELYSKDSQLENSFEVYPPPRTMNPSTPTTRGISATPDPSMAGGFISFPSKNRSPDPKDASPFSSLVIGCNSHDEIYYAYDTKPVIMRFNKKGEKIGEKAFAEPKGETTNKGISSTKNANTLKVPLERSGTLRKGNRPPSSMQKPMSLTIPIPQQTHSTKTKSMRTLLAIDPFNNVFVYQAGYIYVLNISLDSVQAKGKVNFEPDYMMVTEMGQIILATREDTMIHVY